MADVELPPPDHPEPPFGRTRHPYFMHDMIRRQSVATHATRRSIREALAAAPIPPPVGTVLTVGLGTSFHAALATAWAFGRSPRVAGAEAWTAFDLLQRPERLASRPTTVVFSASGETALTVAALHRLRAAGAPTLLVTATPGSPAAALADRVLATEHSAETSWVHTVSFTTALAAAGVLLESWAGVDGSGEDRDAQATDDVTGGLATESAMVTLAEALTGRDRYLLVGGGAAEASAREGALKLREGAGKFSAWVGVEELLHGVLPSVTERTAVVGFSTTALERARLREGLHAAELVGARTVLIDASGAPAAEGTVVVPPSSGPLASAVMVIPVQLLTYWVALSDGRNPDVMGLDDPRLMEARRTFGI